MTYIRPVAICVFRKDDKVLVAEGFDSVKGEAFYRPLGGGIEFGERSSYTIQCEIKEEIGAEVTNLRLLGTLENIFTYLGIPSHKIIQIYDGEFVDKSLYETSIPGIESGGEKFVAMWRRLDSFGEHSKLVPEGLLQLLRSRHV